MDKGVVLLFSESFHVTITFQRNADGVTVDIICAIFGTVGIPLMQKTTECNARMPCTICLVYKVSNGAVSRDEVMLGNAIDVELVQRRGYVTNRVRDDRKTDLVETHDLACDPVLASAFSPVRVDEAGARNGHELSSLYLHLQGRVLQYLCLCTDSI